MLDYLTRNHDQVKRLLLLALLLSVVPFLLLTIFSHPAHDDFNFAIRVFKNGFIATQRDFYLGWTGRYFATAISSLTPLTFGGFVAYKAVGSLAILLTFVSILSLVDAWAKSNVARIDKLIAAAFLTALFSNQTPDVTEAYFWMTGASYYTLGCILTLFFFATATKTSDKSPGFNVISSVASCLLIIAIVGSNETLMVILLLAVLPITIKKWIDKKADRRMWVIYTAIAITCAAVVIAAPGNAVRGGYFPGKHRFFFSLGMSLLQESRFLLTWLFNPAFIMGTIFFIPVAGELSEKTKILRQVRVHPLLISLWLLIMVFAGFFPAYWSTGLLGQHRTVNEVWLFFMIGWFVNILIWVNYLKQERGLRPFPSLPKYAYIIGVPLLLFSLFSLNNTRAAIADLVSLRAYHYDIAVKQRYAQFEQCGRAGHIESCPASTISDLPTTITNPYFETEFGYEKQFWLLRTASAKPE